MPGNYNNFNGRGFQNNQQDLSSTPAPVKITSFYDDKGNIKVDLFDSEAKKIAESFKGKNKKGYAVGVSSTQLRRIFDEVKRYEQILTGSSEKWNETIPYIKMIKSKVAYSIARAAKKTPDEKEVYKNLEVFIASSIDLIKNEKDYHVFVSLFEAAYGFYYELAPKNCQ